MLKQAIFKPKGMNRDLAVSAFSPEFAYENKNIRLLSSDNNTTLSIVNEKGNKKITLKDLKLNIISLEGVVIGLAVVSNILVLFSKGTKDHIYKLTLNGEDFIVLELYKGNLNFNVNNPLETMPIYENEDIKKVYWVDGINLPRVININASDKARAKWDDTSFDFVRSLNLLEEVVITKNSNSGGMFPIGTLQYVFTYYDKFGLESNIFYTSPLYYTSLLDRGGSPEDKSTNSFTIKIKHVDTIGNDLNEWRNTPKFDYVRIYSILTSSIDATPQVKRVADISPSKLTDGYTHILRDEPFYFNARPTQTYIQERKTLREVLLSTLNPAEWNFNPIKYGKIIVKDDKEIYMEIELPYTQLSDVFIKKKGEQVLSLSMDTSLADEILFVKDYRDAYYGIEYKDTGTAGEIIDPTELLYVGGEPVSFYTLAQKDNTLFLGNYSLLRKSLSNIKLPNLKELFRKLLSKLLFTVNKNYTLPYPSGSYPYKSTLNYSSNSIKTFKYLEWYRFGVLALHKTGKWSEPIWIGDLKNTEHLQSNFLSNKISLTTAELKIDDNTILQALKDNGYVKLRPLVVYPSINDREAICLGILCPTVYNVEDRILNAPYALSSWFIRPNAPFTVLDHNSVNSDWKKNFNPNTSEVSEISRSGITKSENPHYSNEPTNIKTIVNSGARAESRHNTAIPGANERNGEIQCLEHNKGSNPCITDRERQVWAYEHREFFFVDLSIVTLHSPDIEFDDLVKNLNLSNLKLRIVGMVPYTSNTADIDIQTSTPVMPFKYKDVINPIGFYKETINTTNISHMGYKGLISGAFWFDEVSGRGSENKGNNVGFAVYPWQRNGSLNNTKTKNDKGIRSSMLSKKKISNLKYSFNSLYLDTSKIWYSNVHSSLFNSDEKTLIKIPKWSPSKDDTSYYGNVERIIVPVFSGRESVGYPIYCTKQQDENSEGDPLHDVFITKYLTIALSDLSSNDTTGYDPVEIKYKSTPHIAMQLERKHELGKYYDKILPTIKDNDDIVNNSNYNIELYYSLFWEKDEDTHIAGYKQDVIDTGIQGESKFSTSILYGWSWLGELYNDNVINRFGGDTEEALENNKWLPCGEPVNINTTSVTLKWTEGDTYYLRYDHLKTYPFTLEDLNSVVEIASFMCETRVNIDGRYDRNRGLSNNLSVTPVNFNKLNKVYSLENNFFSYRYLNENMSKLDNFKNSITWTKTKQLGAIIDKWTNITLASTLEVDGDKGPIRAIKRFNNNLIAFLDSGISLILYNENVLIASTEGVPIEIANSGKVLGKRYITDKIGCINKWSICETPNGIYFIDDLNKDIYLFNGQINNISDKGGFHSWINTVSNINIWSPNPELFNNIVSYYDRKNGDVLFINKDLCLAFSEPLGSFSSFYSYENTPYIINLQDRTFAIKDSEIWELNEGEYNYYYGKYEPFYTLIIVNLEPTTDKIFDTVEFRADTWNGKELTNKTFDKLYTKNEYLRGESNLEFIRRHPSNLKLKFRIWRVNIPRDISNFRDRMRNPWLELKLSMEKENNYKTQLHDIIVKFFLL